jgi:beta-lactamase superfamily II metal-dependent hydrolase
MTLTTGPDHITVRMYNVGFGDAFLIVFPTGGPPCRVLVDCGSHASGPGPRPMEEVVGRIVEDVTDADGVARIDLVVGTHRHRDHVSGFALPKWSAVEVGEVWMPWTEDPEDPVATRIRERQSAVARALTLAAQHLAADAPERALAENALANARAMDTLHRGFAGSPVRRFLPDGQAVVSDPGGAPLAGGKVVASVLGPPRDDAIIRDMDPPQGAGYLRLITGGGAAEDEPPPFGASWTVDPEALAQDERLERLLLSEKRRAAIEAAADVSLFGVAVALEKAINGTSLVLAFRLGDACLLFSGDAQWGTWKRLLDSRDATALLERTSFVKVGHHGSHNATPRRFVELLAGRPDPPPSWAMVSTRTMSRWKEIPKAELIDALGGVAQLARSDEAAAAPFAGAGDAYIDAFVPI